MLDLEVFFICFFPVGLLSVLFSIFFSFSVLSLSICFVLFCFVFQGIKIPLPQPWSHKLEFVYFNDP